MHAINREAFLAFPPGKLRLVMGRVLWSWPWWLRWAEKCYRKWVSNPNGYRVCYEFEVVYARPH